MWLTSFGGGIEGSTDLSESVTRIQAIHVEKDVNFIIFEVWSEYAYIRTMMMSVDDVGNVTQAPVDVGYALRLGPADDLYLSEDKPGVVYGFSGVKSPFAKIVVFEICVSCATSAEKPTEMPTKKPTEKPAEKQCSTMPKKACKKTGAKRRGCKWISKVKACVDTSSSTTVESFCSTITTLKKCRKAKSLCSWRKAKKKKNVSQSKDNIKNNILFMLNNTYFL